MNAQPAILTRDLTRRFGETVAVDSLTLEIYPGEVFGCLGHNGAGKTTTVRLLNGLLTPSVGMVQVLGLSPQCDGPALRRHTGVLTETPSLDERLTARENLHIYADLYGIPSTDVTHRAMELLKMFDLADRADEKVGGYSKGMKQRLALARAMLHNPKILFLDEPTAGLDPVAARQVNQLIIHLSRKEGRTIFLCTHNLNEAQRLCDRVAVMSHGRLVALGAPAELARQVVFSVRLEIDVAPEETELALGILRSGAGITELAQANGSITATCADREMIPALLALLVASGVRVYRLNPQEPSLEDVYFALQGDRESML